MEPYSNGQLEEVAAARDAQTALNRVRRLEFLLIVITMLAAVAAMGFSGWSSNRTRQFGKIIADCTTPKGRCYEDNRAAAIEYRNFVLAKLDEIRTQVLDSAQCQTLQILQHRDSNESAHQKDAKAHGYTYVAPPAEAPIPIPQQLKDACQQFLAPHEGGTR